MVFFVDAVAPVEISTIFEQQSLLHIVDTVDIFQFLTVDTVAHRRNMSSSRTAVTRTAVARITPAANPYIPDARSIVIMIVPPLIGNTLRGLHRL